MASNHRPLTVPLSTLALVLSLTTACGDDDSTPAPDAAGAVDASTVDAPAMIDAGPPTTFGGSRPAMLLVPDSYVAGTPVPLVIALHGYNENSTYVTEVFKIEQLRQSEGFLLIAPQGTLDTAVPTPKYFWNATDACCNLFGAAVDDVAYLNGLVDEIAAAYDVDPARIYVIGHSNGGFMAHRLACESAGRFAAIVSIAGATYDDVAACTPSQPISVLQVHGTSDDTIEYEGGSIDVQGTPIAFPSATGTVSRWATLDGCAQTTTAGTALDLVNPAGDETSVLAYDGCPAGVSVELWTIEGGNHVFFPRDAAAMWAWLEAHPRS